MSLPSQEVLDDISALISEITGFQENDENFIICQKYCLSHVVHHSYPYVNRTTVKDLMSSYVSRFYGHGYFRVSQELNYQLKKFLSNEKVFEKNQQFDIQWCLLSLLSSLTSNLSDVKGIPDLLTIDDEDNVSDDIIWSDYLIKDLPLQQNTNFYKSGSSESDEYSDTEEEYGKSKDVKISSKILGNQNKLSQVENKANCSIFKQDQQISEASILRKEKLEELRNNRKAIIDFEYKFMPRGDISKKFDLFMSKEGMYRNPQYVTEYEMMEYILYEFQTGEKMLAQRGLNKPALLSITQETMCNFLESLKPYTKIIRSFKDFDNEITAVKYPEKFVLKNCETMDEARLSSSTCSNAAKAKVSNVLYIYNLMLKKALEPFQNEIMKIVDQMDSYTLIKMQRKLEEHFSFLTSIYYVHTRATKNWKNESNWMISIRVLSVLYNAVTDASTTKMSFLYLNIFLHCFQVYLDIIDSWISFLNLNDPNDEFIITKSGNKKNSEDFCSDYENRPSKTDLENAGIKEIPVLNFFSDRVIHMGLSLEVLRRLGKFVNDSQVQESSFRKIVEKVNEKISTFAELKYMLPEPRVQEKKKSIFTMSNVSLVLDRDNGSGDSSEIGTILEELLKEEESKNKQGVQTVAKESKLCRDYCFEFIQSTISNQYFKMAFEDIGLPHPVKLNNQKISLSEDVELMIVREPDSIKSSVYPYHKIVCEACYQTIEKRMSDTCLVVKRIVLEDCHLKSHLSLLRNVFLFNESYLIQPFIIGFYTQPIIWESSYSLTLHLKECLESRYKELASSLSVSVVKNSLSMEWKNVLQAIGAITINYEVNWPLTLFFTPEIMNKYNQVFRLAMKLKWAHWVLTNLDFENIKEKESGNQKFLCHRLQILRFWFLSTLNRINNYFMAQMMIPTPLELDSKNDLKDIIDSHVKFINSIHHHSLLSGKAPEMRAIIFETLIPLCLDLEKLWMNEESIDESKLTSIETIFGNCQFRLCQQMSSIEKD